MVNYVHTTLDYKTAIFKIAVFFILNFTHCNCTKKGQYMEHDKKEARLIFSTEVARSLFKAGCTAIDCKTNRLDPNKTIIVFKNDELFKREFERIKEEIAKSKKQNEEE